jgi:hypothetical protein
MQEIKLMAEQSTVYFKNGLYFGYYINDTTKEGWFVSMRPGIDWFRYGYTTVYTDNILRMAERCADAGFKEMKWADIPMDIRIWLMSVASSAMQIGKFMPTFMILPLDSFEKLQDSILTEPQKT